MNVVDWERVQKLVEAALALAKDDRESFLERECGNDSALLEEIQSLIRFEERAEGFLEAPSPDGIKILFSRPVGDEWVGRRIGRFELTGVLGHGGMGVVYRATQDKPRREVALKVARTAGPIDRRRLRLYEREVQSLARLRHRSIAAIYEAGATDDGQHYFAMELVTGPSVTEYARGKPLTRDDKLKLFCEICDAVQYAHRRGVIHRDLKPSNILIDAEGIPKVLDFGLAKITDADVAVTTMATEVGRVQGTLAYMSPEQARGGGDDIDNRSDVYSLGVILHELLAERHPYDTSRTTLVRAIQVICEEPPQKLGALHRSLGGDLETITLKALNKEPGRRYQHVEALAADIRHFLAHEPIEARRDSAPYVIGKYLQRHRGRLALVGGALTISLAVAIGLQLARRADDRRERQTELDQLLTEAQDRIDATQVLRTANQELEHDLRGFYAQRTAEYFTPEKDSQMHRAEDRLASVQAQRDENFHAVLELLRRAEYLGGEADRVRHLRGAIFLEECLDELNHGNTIRADELRKHVLANDPTGELEKRLAGKRDIGFQTDLIGVPYYLFELVEQSQWVVNGERRLVPIPVERPVLPVPPGTWCLRVIAGSGPIQPSDLIVSIAGYPVRDSVLVAKGEGRIQPLDRLMAIDGIPVHSAFDVRTLGSPQNDIRSRVFEFERGGERFTVHGSSLQSLGIEAVDLVALAEVGGVPAEVWQTGSLKAMVLPAGLRVQVTSRPLFTFPQAQRQPGTVNAPPLSPGRYLMLFRKPGHEEVWFAWQHGQGMMVPPLYLPPIGTTPSGFQYVSTFRGVGVHPFWMKVHEVTCGEYLQFVNDPQSLSRINESPVPIYFPRSKRNAESGGHWRRDANGLFELPESWRTDWPVFGVSWHDAVAYTEWRTQKAQAEGLNYRFSLPTLDEWSSACMQLGGEQKFVYGFRFRAKWMSSCFARAVPGIEPVMSFPNDESVYGIYDTAGSVSEWLDEWWLKDRDLRRIAGGSWADGGPEDIFGISGGNGMRPNQVSDSVGFRMVLRMPSATPESPSGPPLP